MTRDMQTRVAVCHHDDMPTNFEALIQSFGEHILSYVGRDHLRSVIVQGDSRIGTADVELTLDDFTWEEQSRATGKMLEVQEIFLDELAISYHFTEAGNDAVPGGQKLTTLCAV